jgi:hypothetical protein
MTAIHPMLDFVAVNVRTMTHVELGNFVINLADAFAGHKKFQDPDSIPPPLLKPDQLKALGVGHLAITKDADSGDRFKKAQRDAMRPLVELHPVMLINWAGYKAVVENDPSYVDDLRLPPKGKAASKAAHDLAVPENPKAKHGKSGEALVSVGRVATALAYYVGVCKGDPSQAESWSTVGPFHKSQNMSVPGLEPGQLYYFRIACVDSNGQSDWSPIISLRIL